MCEYEHSTQAYWARRMTARQQHRCDECRRVIRAGEHYERVRGIWDGIPDVLKTCPDCLAIRDRVEAAAPERWCWCHTSMLGDAEEEVREWPENGPDRMWVEARLKEAKER